MRNYYFNLDPWVFFVYPLCMDAATATNLQLSCKAKVDLIVILIIIYHADMKMMWLKGVSYTETTENIISICNSPQVYSAL